MLYDDFTAKNSSFIDVKELITQLSDEELMRSADAYFSKMTLTSEQCHKPFSNPNDAIHLTRHLGLIFEVADLFRKANVLDFGCATGWLTIGLAQMGCDAIGVDISPNALRLAQDMAANREASQGSGSLEFHAYDGKYLPLDDESVDRIICFDAFHHVRDQKSTITEFARILKRGGRVAFIEPGPNHSKTVASQTEMALFNVIENDIEMEKITQYALEAGLDEPQILVQFQQPFTISANEFNDWIAMDIEQSWAVRAISILRQQLNNEQCFFITKGNQEHHERDSRCADGLAAKITVITAQRVAPGSGYGISLEIMARNIGTRYWLNTGTSGGQVNLGVHVLSSEGKMLDNNFARLNLPHGPIAPGEEVILKGTIGIPDVREFILRLDMVSELVTWFSDLKHTQPVIVHSQDL